jgi:hypothetical protein
MGDPLPEVTLLSIAEVVARWLPGENDLTSQDAMGEILDIVQQAGVPFPRSEEEALAIRESNRLD